MTMVRMKVAKSALTFSTPTLAKIAVRAANTADATAQNCQNDSAPSMSGFAHIAGLAAGEKIGARRRENVDDLGVFVEPALVLDAARDHHDVAGAAHTPLVAYAELHAALEHPDDLLVGVLMRLHVHAAGDAPPDDHALLAGYDPARDFFAELLLRQRCKRAEASEPRHAVPSWRAPVPNTPAPCRARVPSRHPKRDFSAAFSARGSARNGEFDGKKQRQHHHRG